MTMRMNSLHFRMLPVLAAALAASACSSVLDLDVRLVTESCDGTAGLDPLATVTHLRFTPFGEGIDALTEQKKVALSGKELTLPDMPAKKGVNLVAEALSGTGDVISRGETGPMDLTVTDGKVSVGIFLRRVDTFTSTNDRDKPGVCTQMASARMGHTATVLSDGRVLIAGGSYPADDGGLMILKSTEIYDPRTGKSTRGPNMNMSRRFHTATPIPGTTLTVITGGEGAGNGPAGAALSTAEIYDEKTGSFVVQRMNAARVHHAAAVPLDGGRLLVAGGYDQVGAPLKSTETFDPATGKFTEGPELTAARGDLSAVGLSDGRVLVAGGTSAKGETGAAVTATDLFSAKLDGYERTDAAPLDAARLSPLLAPFGKDRVLVAGGFSAKGTDFHALAVDSSEVLDLSPEGASRPATPMSHKRGRGGIVALPDGRVLVAGGVNDEAGALHAVPQAELFVAGVATGEDPEAPVVTVDDVVGPMQKGRFRAAYALLQDGTVLVTGGVTSGDKPGETLATVEVYQPAYLVGAMDPHMAPVAR